MEVSTRRRISGRLLWQTHEATMTLMAGFKVDRFGAESGRFLGAADAPFTQRSPTPDALNVCQSGSIPCNTTKDHPWGYYVYNVTRAFEVIGGPIAPEFGQPGPGVQFYTGRIGNISQLVGLGLLKRLKLSDCGILLFERNLRFR